MMLAAYSGTNAPGQINLTGLTLDTNGGLTSGKAGNLTVIAPGGQEFVTTRAGNVIRVEAAAGGDAAGNWQVWHAGRIIRGQAGAAEFTVLPARKPLTAGQ